MEGLFFAIGFLLGGVVGVLIMCLLQINRIRQEHRAFRQLFHQQPDHGPGADDAR